MPPDTNGCFAYLAEPMPEEGEWRGEQDADSIWLEHPDARRVLPLLPFDDILRSLVQVAPRCVAPAAEHLPRPIRITLQGHWAWLNRALNPP